MKNRGYTLLEVLGVIVILAVLTTIVFPSVINFIKKSSDEIDEYSMKLISNAADLYIKARKDSYIEYNDNKYIIDVQNLIDDGNLPESIKKSDINNIKDKCIQVEYKGYKFNYELKDKGTCKQKVQLESICTLASDSEVTGYNAGAKYKCKVDPNKEPYTFYVLTTPKTEDTRINLIMDQNINSDGTPAGMTGVIKNGDNVYSLVAWINQGDYESVGGQNWSSWTDNNAFGPITAMNFLSEATKNWTNTNEIKTSTIAYENGTTYTMPKTYYTNARMPMYSSDASKTEVADKTESNAYLYTNLDPEGMNAPYGYWTLSPFAENSSDAWFVTYDGTVHNYDVFHADRYGVRPVITLSLPNKLPDEYQQVEYVESTGTQYIELDYVASNITNSKGTYKLTDIETGSMLFGSRKSATENSYTFNWGGNSKPYKYYNAFYMATTDNGITTKEIDLNKHTFEKRDITLYIDDELISSRTDMASKVFNTPNKMIIFGCNTNGTIGLHSKVRIFNLQFYDEDILKINLIPCYRKSDNIIGMYDTVQERFYTNLGTGTFLKGKDI